MQPVHGSAWSRLCMEVLGDNTLVMGKVHTLCLTVSD
jgi:hypothetical protein